MFKRSLKYLDKTIAKQFAVYAIRFSSFNFVAAIILLKQVASMRQQTIVIPQEIACLSISLDNIVTRYFRYFINGFSVIPRSVKQMKKHTTVVVVVFVQTDVYCTTKELIHRTRSLPYYGMLKRKQKHFYGYLKKQSSNMMT